MDNEDHYEIVEMHAERVTISGGRYLIFYTFTDAADSDGTKAVDIADPETKRPIEL